jgi:hypothetical protein
VELERVALTACDNRFMPWFEVLIQNTDVADLKAEVKERNPTERPISVRPRSFTRS